MFIKEIVEKTEKTEKTEETEKPERTERTRGAENLEGYITVNSEQFTADPLVLLFPSGTNESAGLIQSGTSPGGSIHIGFPKTKSDGGEQIFIFPAMYEDPKILTYHNAGGDVHHAVIGTVRISVSHGFGCFKGDYEFTDKEGKVFRGDFDLYRKRQEG